MRFGGLAGDLLPTDANLAACRAQQAHDGADRRRLAHAVAAHEGEHFALMDGERDAEQHLALPVSGFHAG